MKYVKARDPPPTPETLAKIKAGVIDQLDQYSAARDLAAEWRLNQPVESGTVTLHRLLLVFHGGKCVMSEEV